MASVILKCEPYIISLELELTFAIANYLWSYYQPSSTQLAVFPRKLSIAPFNKLSNSCCLLTVASRSLKNRLQLITIAGPTQKLWKNCRTDVSDIQTHHPN